MHRDGLSLIQFVSNQSRTQETQLYGQRHPRYRIHSLKYRPAARDRVLRNDAESQFYRSQSQLGHGRSQCLPRRSVRITSHARKPEPRVYDWERPQGNRTTLSESSTRWRSQVYICAGELYRYRSRSKRAPDRSGCGVDSTWRAACGRRDGRAAGRKGNLGGAV